MGSYVECEECDQLQGVQILADVDNAWGGFAACYLDSLRDEMGKLSMWVWGLDDGQPDVQSIRRQRIINSARSMHQVGSLASLYIPITDSPVSLPPTVAISRGSKWHSSALLSTAVETMTIPTRLRALEGQRATLFDLEQTLRLNGNQKVVKLGLGIDRQKPSNHHSGPVGGDHLDHKRLPNGSDPLGASALAHELEISLFPGAVGHLKKRAKMHTFSRVEVTRDASANEWGSEQGRPMDSTTLERFRTSLQFPLLDSFPPIYTETVNGQRTRPCRTALTVESSIADHIRSMQAVVSRAVEPEEREALLNSLGEIAESYQYGWNSGDESEED
ncbi:MAG: mtDNA inheritance, partitioning of the mitochondrial organelle [Phylliscum demangeonii]|nr:MAG: mtDNA inheritance, partitioning of the mitochondrial organelle [Phylliscum demangeonii]